MAMSDLTPIQRYFACSPGRLSIAPAALADLLALRGLSVGSVKTVVDPSDPARLLVDRNAVEWRRAMCKAPKPAVAKSAAPSARWAELHARSVLPVADAKAERRWITELADDMLGTCQCRSHWRQYVAKHRPAVTTPEAYERWAVDAHNAVNKRLGKPLWAKPVIVPDRVVVLSLDSRPDRWDALTASIDTSTHARGWPVQRYRARPPSEMIVPDWWTWGDTIYATGKDHLAIIEQAYVDGCEHLVILEDDAILQDGFDAAYEAACRVLPAGWLGLWLTSDGHKRPPVPIAPGLVRSVDQAMLHAYMLNRAGMRRVWHHLTTCYRQIVDGATEDLHSIEPRFYATEANAVRQFGDRFRGVRTEFFAAPSKPKARPNL